MRQLRRFGQSFGRLYNSLWSGIITGVVITTAVLLPIAASADTTLKVEAGVGVANVTAGDSSYKPSVAATNNQVVKIQVNYKNTGSADQVANNLRVKLTLPAGAGKDQVISAGITSDNSDQVMQQATVTLDQENARLQYIPGSAVWKHNTSSDNTQNILETKLNDDVVLGAQGGLLENVKAGNNFEATVTILARVVTPGVNTTTETQLKSESNKWSANNTAVPGAVMRHIINYQNTGNTEQKQVVVRNALAAKEQLVPGSVKLFNTTNPGGVAVADTVVSSGVNIGNYGPGANAYVTFEAQIAAADQLSCGNNEFRSVSAVQPEGMSEYYAASVTTVNRDCAAAATGETKSGSSCDLLTVTKLDGFKIATKVDYKAANGAQLKTISYDFGDGSQPLVTDKTTANYTYAKTGAYTVTAKVTVTSNGKDEVLTSAPCAQAIDFTAAAATTPTAGKSGDLPKSGPGSMFGLFVGATFIGFVVHRMYSIRKMLW